MPNLSPYVIIPPEHQSAPKTAPLIAPVLNTTATAPASSRKPRDLAFDDELEGPPCYRSDDAQTNRQFLEMYKQSLLQERLNAVEEALRQWERNTAAVKDYRWHGQERWQGRENEEMRLVRILHPHTIMARLRRAGVEARIDESKQARIWLNSWSKLGRVGVNAWIAPPEGLDLSSVAAEHRNGQRIAQTITTLQYPYGPEYSIMRFDAHNLPTAEKYRGWRTALLALIVANVLTEAEVERAFGPAIGPAGEFYREQLYYHRRIVLGIEQ